MATIRIPNDPADPPSRDASVSARLQTVLVVDDEPVVRDVVSTYLAQAGYRVIEAVDGWAARSAVKRQAPDLVVLDVVMPEISGLEVCRWIRTRYDIPVILLSARSHEADRIVGLDLGADDYVTKPFSPRELVMRVGAVLRRTTARPEAPPRITFADMVLDGTAREVTKSGNPVSLTELEFDLLWFLASHPGRAFSRDQLMICVWGYSAARDTGVVTVFIRRLREKIETDASRPRHLATVWGVGYRFAL